MTDEVTIQPVVHGATLITGGYTVLPIVDVSYYPAEHIRKRVAETIYGFDPYNSERWKRAETENRTISRDRPLAHMKVTGTFILFQREKERPWAMMEISMLHPNERSQQDITLSVVPALALMPCRLYINSGQMWQVGDKTMGNFMSLTEKAQAGPSIVTETI